MRKNSKNTLISIVVIIAVCFVAIKFVIPALTSGIIGDNDGGAEEFAKEVVGILEDAEKEEQKDEVKEEETPVPDNTSPVIGDEIYVDFIDVGQGDSTLIYDKTASYSVLIDTGLYEAYDNVQTALSEYGIEKVNALVLTHPDTDHIQSAVDVIKDYDVEKVYMSEVQNPDAKAYEYLMNYLDTYTGEVIYPKVLDTIETGSQNASVFFMGPVVKPEEGDTNSGSLIVKLVNADDSFLFVGDATGYETNPIMEMGLKLDADVLKASHHGSANEGCNSETFVRYVDPSYMVVSCGYQNEHGHPHIETMELVQKMNISLYRTDLQGSISCVSTGSGITFSQEPTDNYLNGNAFK